VALLERIAQIGRDNGILTILVDIPVRTGPHGTHSSFTADVRKAGKASFGHVLESDEYLSGHPPNQALHVPNGHHHINAYTHRRLGERLALILANRR
jgi:hypothetical protein